MHSTVIGETVLMEPHSVISTAYAYARLRVGEPVSSDVAERRAEHRLTGQPPGDIFLANAVF